MKSAVFGFGMFFAGVSWVYVSIHDHGFIPAPLALIATTLFCLFIALLFALPFALSALIPQRSGSWLIGLPAIWVLSEWFRSWILTGFPWLYSGYIHTETWLSGWAPIGGVLWLSFLTALAAATLSQLTQPHRNQRSVKVAFLAITLTVVSGYFLQQIRWTRAHRKKPLSGSSSAQYQIKTRSGPTAKGRGYYSNSKPRLSRIGVLILLSGQKQPFRPLHNMSVIF